ncbi:MAG: polysaccharide deacetylase family protein [Solirubrobacteraceae bacterium]
MIAPLHLTFDDGPDPVWTPRILDALRAARLRATFFVIAPRAAAHAAIVRRARREGHAVELHCHEHVRHTELDPAEGRTDTRRALTALAALGVRPRRWRTPWGVHAPWTAEVAREHDLELCGWDVDTHDWRGDSAEAMLAAIGSELHQDAVVLLHDGIGPGARRDGCAETLRLVEILGAEAAAA